MTTQMNFGPDWMRSGNSSNNNNNKQKHSSTRDTNDFFLNSEEYQPINKQYHQYVSMTEENENPLSFLDFNNIKTKNFNLSDTLALDTEDDIPSWNSVDKNSLGTFDINGVFQLEPTSTTSPIKELPFADTIDTQNQQNSFVNMLDELKFKKEVVYNWYYCDPSSIIQGPFTSQEMQDWYKAGYFDPYLSVKREDAPGFETLANLINRVGDSSHPFLAPWSSAITTTSVFPENYKHEAMIFPGALSNQLYYNDHQQKEVIKDASFSYNNWQNNDDILFLPNNHNEIPRNTVDIHQKQYVNMLRHNQQQHLILQQKILLEQQQTLQYQHELLMRSQQKTEQRWFFADQSSNKTEVPIMQEKVEATAIVDKQITEALSSLHIEEPLQIERNNIVETENYVPKSESSMHTRSNTWTSASLKSNETSPTNLTPSQSSTLSKQRTSNSTWNNKPPVRQKHLSMTASIPPHRKEQPVSNTVTKSAAVNKTVHSISDKKPSEDFIKWCKLSLRDLNPGVNEHEILNMLLSFPVDNNDYSEIIQDIIYANSASLDGRRFANDFMTRRKEDMQGKKINITLPKSTSETSEFKVVTKKGKKRH